MNFNNESKSEENKVIILSVNSRKVKYPVLFVSNTENNLSDIIPGKT